MFVGMGANGASGYNLTDSLRFRRSASSDLSRIPTTEGNRKTWTWSAWVKRGEVSSTDIYILFAARVNGNSSEYTIIYFDNDELRFLDNGGASLISTSLYRDTSAWYHIVCSVDTTQATSTNRVKMYVNGEQLTSFSTATYPTQNIDTHINSTLPHCIGKQFPSQTSQIFDGYMTEINLVDGQQLTASAFGSYDAITGVWKPKKYTGTYGTNGFYLPMNKTVEGYSVEYLVIAGGGGGAGGASNGGGAGGGGAGGYRTGNLAITNGVEYTVTVGAGGAGGPAGVNNGSSGSNSVFGPVVSVGGGYGGKQGISGGDGGSGGGAGALTSAVAGGLGIGGQGNNGGSKTSNYVASSGGGAGTAGAAGSPGGAGLTSSITGSAVTRAGGGGGGYQKYTAPTAAQAGGSGGGGAGSNNSVTATAGAANTGSGGGGGSSNATPNFSGGGAGGSGIVILRMPTSKYTGIVTGSPTVTTNGSDTIIQFTSDGSYTA